MNEYEMMRIMVDLLEACEEMGVDVESCLDDVWRAIERAWDNAQSKLGV